MDIHKSLAQHLRADAVLAPLFAEPAEQIGYAFDTKKDLPQIAVSEVQRTRTGPITSWHMALSIRAAPDQQDTIRQIRERFEALFEDQWNYPLSSGGTALQITWSECIPNGEGITKDDEAGYLTYQDDYLFSN